MQGRNAGENLLQSGLPQARQPFGLCRAPDLRTGPPLDNHFADIIRQIQQFVNSCAAAIAGVIAGVTADVHVERPVTVLFGLEAGFHQLGVTRMIRPFAVSTEHTNQALGQNAVE